MRRACTLTLTLVLIAASTSEAQTRPGARPASRVFVSVNAAFQLSSNDFSDNLLIRENGEDGAVDSDYVVKSGPALDVTAGAVIWRRLAIGVGVTRFSRTTPTTVRASVPHPFFFNRPRSVSGEASGLRREELAVHVQARAVLPVTRRVVVMVFGGPSFYQLKQGLVNEVAYSESYPYDEATFDGANTGRAAQSPYGFNVGGDVAYFFSRQVGIGFGAQYAGAKGHLPSADGDTVEARAGGAQAGGGLRLRF